MQATLPFRDHDADVIVVGSGPSGVSVALPMVEAGRRVLMVDGGRTRPDVVRGHAAYHDARRNDPDQWRRFLGPDLGALRPTGPPSPKLRAPASGFAIEGFERWQPVDTHDMVFAGSLARGGLSTIWGAGLGVYDDDDLAGFPLGLDDLAESFVRVTRRIGGGGFGDDDLTTRLDARMPRPASLRRADAARMLFERYAAHRDRVRADGLRLGRPRVAVATEPDTGVEACALCDACLWGCPLGSIWSAERDLNRLARYPGFSHRSGLVVDGIERMSDGYRVRAIDRERTGVTLSAPRVVLAAGTLATTRLLLALENRYDETLRVLTSPTAGFALLLPGRLGAALSTRDYSMAQVSFSEGETADTSYGNLFTASGLPGALLVERMPLSRRGAVRLFRGIQSALLVGNVFLPGSYSRNTLRLERRASGPPHMHLVGQRSAEQQRRFAISRGRLSRGFRRLGAWTLPSSFTVAEPGADLRHAGTYPMRADPGPGEVSTTGEVFGHPGLHAVDLSVFPALGAKHPTLTLMANADRIGHLLAVHDRR